MQWHSHLNLAEWSNNVFLVDTVSASNIIGFILRTYCIMYLVIESVRDLILMPISESILIMASLHLHHFCSLYNSSDEWPDLTFQWNSRPGCDLALTTCGLVIMWQTMTLSLQAHAHNDKHSLTFINHTPTSSGADESSSTLLASGSPAKGLRRVCRKSAAFLFLSACSCFSLDSLDAWASFSLAAAARRSSSFCLAKGEEIRGCKKEMVGWQWKNFFTHCPFLCLPQLDMPLLNGSEEGENDWKDRQKERKCDCVLVFTQADFSWLQLKSLRKAKNSKWEERGRKDTDGDTREKERSERDKKYQREKEDERQGGKGWYK